MRQGWETVNSRDRPPYRMLGKHFQETGENRHFPFQGPYRSILSREISGLESVPRAILRMIRFFVRISHPSSEPLCWEQYPLGGRHPNGYKAARDVKSRLPAPPFHTEAETTFYARNLLSISQPLSGDNNRLWLSRIWRRRDVWRTMFFEF